MLSGQRISKEEEDTRDGAADWNLNNKREIHEWTQKSFYGCVQKTCFISFI